jgi:hypothetical protein
MHGVKQDVGISSIPTGASVEIDSKPYCKTPVVAKLSRKDNHLNDETTLTKKVSGWVWRKHCPR